MLARVLAAALFTLLALAPAARAEDPPVLTVTSLGGAPEAMPARAGAWLPLEVTIDAKAAFDAVLRCRRVGQGVRSPILYERRVTLAAGGKRTESLLFFLPAPAGEAAVELFREGAGEDRPLASARFTWKEADEPLLLGISRDGSAHRLVSRVDLGWIARAPARGLSLKPEELPASAVALEMATAVFIVNADLRALSPAQGEALRGYAEAGGQVVLVFSGSALELRGTEVEALLPCEVLGATPRATPVLGAFGAGVAAEDGTAPLLADVRPLPGATVLLAEDGRPLAVRRRVGAGAVTYLDLVLDSARRH